MVDFAKAVKDHRKRNLKIFIMDPDGYQYWIIQHKGMAIPFQNGLFGQYVFAIKEKNAVVVRLGESKPIKPIHHHQPEIYSYLDAALSVLK